jgi:predicted GTPase
VEAVLVAAQRLNPKARCYITASEVSVDKPDLVKGKRVLWCVESPSTPPKEPQHTHKPHCKP